MYRTQSGQYLSVHCTDKHSLMRLYKKPKMILYHNYILDKLAYFTLTKNLNQNFFHNEIIKKNLVKCTKSKLIDITILQCNK